MRYFKQPRHHTKWMLALALGTISLVSLLFTYMYLDDSWTCMYANKMVVVGRNLTQEAQAVMDKHPDWRKSDLVMSTAGNLSPLWPDWEVQSDRFILMTVYCAISMAAALTLLCTVQVVSIPIRK
jgi:hypothetical protein